MRSFSSISSRVHSKFATATASRLLHRFESLPGNPVSTMVTFQLFVAPAIELLSGAEALPLPLVEARLADSLNERSGLAHFLPARIEWRGAVPEVKALKWRGSGDIAALAGANCFVVVQPENEKIAAGERVSVLLRKDVV